MRRLAVIVLLVAAMALTLAGCGDFQQRAAQAETRISNAEDAARVAQQAAAQNTARLRELEDRVETLEQQVDVLRDAIEDPVDPRASNEGQ